MARELKVIPLDQIQPAKDGLRTVDKTMEKYIELTDSVKKHGVMNAIVVRPVEAVNGQPRYSLIDGLHRFSAAGDAGFKEIPCNVLDMEASEVLEAQIIANCQKIETRPADYGKALSQIAANNPMLTAVELAGRLSKSVPWLDNMMGLVKLTDKLKELVNEGKVVLTNAVALSKLPPEKQPDFTTAAMTQSPSEFVPMMQKVGKEIRDALRQGRNPNAEFKPTEFLQKLATLKEELRTQKIGKELLAHYKVTDPLAAWALAMQWLFHVDPLSVEAQKKKEEERKAADKKAAEDRKKLREETQKRVAAQIAAEEEKKKVGVSA